MSKEKIRYILINLSSVYVISFEGHILPTSLFDPTKNKLEGLTSFSRWLREHSPENMLNEILRKSLCNWEVRKVYIVFALYI